MDRKFTLDRQNAKLMGVGSGLANYSGVDPLLVRLGLVLAVLVTGPIAIILYIATGWLASDR
ncbi:PspC domain-containing protein [Sphingomonas sp. BN140010]|uniref:PspC domain-containing protein n=1 Tax=Sphingomonas arvum TaxID=2992113 RepID=A0ABT3JFE1_9SPHN|nr:PspC domain-containing protein [Sphingomonas sp. BN140010]MCW3797795.1 PspC domain-containing protein [Sphingomonas sp. BN140010]